MVVCLLYAFCACVETSEEKTRKAKREAEEREGQWQRKGSWH